MKKITALICIIILVCLVLPACNSKESSTFEIFGDIRTSAVVTEDELQVSGDINFSLTTTNNSEYGNVILLDEIFDALDATLSSGEFEGFSLTHSGYYYIILVAKDGTTCKIHKYDTTDMFVYLNGDNQWNVVGDLQPAPVNIKDLESIVIVDEIREGDGFYGVSIFDDEDDIIKTSAGNQYEENCIEYSGLSEQTKNDITVQKGSIKSDSDLSDIAIDLNDYIDYVDQTVMVFATNGEIFKFSGELGYLGVNKYNITYTDSSGTYEIYCMGISGIESTLMAIAEDAKADLAAGNDVIILEVDGLSWSQYIKYDMENLIANQIESSNFSIYSEQMYAVYPTKSEVGLATMLTGLSPYENGVTNKNTKGNFTGSTIFDYATSIGATSAYYEGDSIMLQTTPTATMHSSDYEIYLSVINDINSGNMANMTYIHFHESDDYGSLYGPYAQETEDKMVEIMGYIAQIYNKAVQANPDVVIYIVSDHGMHETPSDPSGLGFHTTTVYEDMVVPYVKIGGSI